MLLLKDKKVQWLVFLAVFTTSVQANFVGDLFAYLGLSYALGVILMFGYIGIMHIFVFMEKEPTVLSIHCSAYYFGFKQGQLILTAMLSMVPLILGTYYVGLNVGFGAMFLANALLNLIMTTYYALQLRRLKKKYLGK